MFVSIAARSSSVLSGTVTGATVDRANNRGRLYTGAVLNFESPRLRETITLTGGDPDAPGGRPEGC